jgi:hypothetical protein
MGRHVRAQENRCSTCLATEDADLDPAVVAGNGHDGPEASMGK